MKKGFSSLELHYVVKELQALVDARVDRIYHPHQECLLLQFFVSSQGKKVVKILLPGFMYITAHKAENPEKPSEFCVQLRNHLDNSFVRSLTQKNSERIIELVFEKKDERFILVIELFSKGNIILCDANYKILTVLFRQTWRDRTIKRNEIYKFPPTLVNLFCIKEKEFKDIIKNSQKDSVVKALAVDLGLGGSYAEELCLMAEVTKNKKSVSENEAEHLFTSFQKLLAKKMKPCIIYSSDKNILDIVPFDLALYTEYEKKYFDSYSEALEGAIQQEIPKEQKQLQLKIEKLERILEQQHQDITNMEERLETEQKSADLLYNNYQLVSEIIAEIKKATSKYNWQEIKEKIKGHKIVKEVNAKDKTIVLELE